MKIIRLLAAASAAFFIAGTALAQQGGTVTQNAFVIGKGPGSTGYTSLLCGSAQLAVGQSAAAPICRTLTGDVTLTAAGVTAIGANKVLDTMLRQGVARSVIGVTGNATANETDIQGATDQILRVNGAGTALAFGSIDLSKSAAVGATILPIANGGTNAATAANARTNLGVAIGSNVEAWDADLDCLAALSGTGILRRTGAGTCSNGTAVALTEMAAQAAYTIVGNFTGSSAIPTAATIGGLTNKTSPTGSDLVLIQDQAASGALKYSTLTQALAAVTSGVSSLNTKTGTLSLIVTKQVFTASGTYTPTAGLLYAQVEAVGGGGAGGGVVSGGGTSNAAGGGGGAGGYSKSIVTAATIGASQTVTVGAAGTGSSGAGGSSGGATSFGAIVIANGGTGGGAYVAGNGTGGAGGSAGTGDFAAAGGSGASTVLISNSVQAVAMGGQGGNSSFGGGGTGGLSNVGVAPGIAARAYGSGGGAASSNASTASAAGGNGSAGVVFITEYCLQ